MLLTQRDFAMGANGQLGKLVGSFVDSQTGKGYQTIGHFEGMTIVTSTERRPISVPMRSSDAIVMGLVRYDERDRVKYISFYNKKTGVIKKSIDIVYDNDGKIVPSQYKMIRGEQKLIGTHSHKWTMGTEGTSGRISHDEINMLPLSKREMQWLNKALKYNNSKNK